MATGPDIRIRSGSSRSYATWNRRRREHAQREADAQAEREAKERLHRIMADYWMATGWPLEDDV